MQTLHGYTIDETQWKAKGGGGQCNTAKKDGKEYFIKRLASPRYPDSDYFSGLFKQKKIDACNEWFRRRQEIIRAIPGSIEKPIEYFREGPCYYEVRNIIDVTSISYYEIYKKSMEDRARFMLIVARSLWDLHKMGIVHGDLNPDNILIGRLKGSRVPAVKLIGFENAFFENGPPEVMSSETAWQSPEVIHYNQAAVEKIAPNPFRKDISCELDIYSLGLIFYLYCTGTRLTCGANYSGQELFGENSLQTAQKIEPNFRILISDMLHDDPSKRLSMIDVCRFLTGDPRVKNVYTSDLQPAQKAKNIFGCANLQIELVAGHGVEHAYIHPRNSRKVVLIFEDECERIMDKEFAMKMGYVKKEPLA